MNPFFRRAALVAAFLPIAGGEAASAQEPPLTVAGYNSENVPRPANATLPVSEASDDWYQVYETAD